MNLRLANFDDWEACAHLSDTVLSTHVWQLHVARDPTQTLTTTEISMTLRCLRLPRPVPAPPPALPLDIAWATALATLVADDDGAILGYITLAADHEPSILAVSRLVVAPAARQHGVASGLLRAGARWAAAQGYGALAAACPARNHPMVACLWGEGWRFAGYNEAVHPRGEVALLWHRSV